MQPRIVTVLKSGGEFMPEHVLRLERQCAEHAQGVEFVCLTDADIACGKPLQNGWPGWWSKIELFLMDGPILYFDLDTTIVGDLSPMLEACASHSFIALRNCYNTPSKLGSGVMGWNGSLRHIYNRFAESPEHHMRRCVTPKVWGDQGFIAETDMPSAFWQDLFPNQVVSWKADCQGGVPDAARVVYFHGKPRPWDVQWPA